MSDKILTELLKRANSESSNLKSEKTIIDEKTKSKEIKIKEDLEGDNPFDETDYEIISYYESQKNMLTLEIKKLKDSIIDLKKENSRLNRKLKMSEKRFKNECLGRTINKYNNSEIKIPIEKRQLINVRLNKIIKNKQTREEKVEGVYTFAEEIKNNFQYISEEEKKKIEEDKVENEAFKNLLDNIKEELADYENKEDTVIFLENFEILLSQRCLIQKKLLSPQQCRLIFPLIEKHKEVIEILFFYFSYEALSNVPLASYILRKDPNLISYFNRNVKNDIRIQEYILEVKPSLFRLLNGSEERRKIKIDKMAIEKNPLNILFAAENFLNNKAFEECAEKNPIIILGIPEEMFKTKKEFIKKILEKRGDLIRFLDPKYKNDREFILAAVKSYPEFIDSLDDIFLSDEGFIRAILISNPATEKYFKEKNLLPKEKIKRKTFKELMEALRK
ncbi:MAG: DUF4116 domain-containing protein [Tissierellia bacterium]|nr:DUF4116 domain-containing protein [Tissierellia bacterium]